MQVFADARLELDGQGVAVAAGVELEAQEEAPGHREDEVIDDAGAGQEHHRGRDQEGQERLAFMLVQARRHEHPDLAGDDRERDEATGPERHLHIGEEGFREAGVDHPAPLPRQQVGQRLDQEIVDPVRHGVAQQKGDQDGADRPHQPVPQFDQMIDQRHLAFFEFVLMRVAGHGPSSTLGLLIGGLGGGHFGRLGCRLSGRLHRCGLHRSRLGRLGGDRRGRGGRRRAVGHRRGRR